MLSMAGQLIWNGGWLDRHTQSHALLASVADAYGDDWWFLGVYGMSHQELDRLEEARRLAERALALRPRSGGGVHALSHVFYETNDHAGGVELLGSWLAGYDRAAPYHCHLSWHLALAELAQGREDRALEVYEQAISPRVAHARTTMSDAASLLWRYQLYGCTPRSLPWAEVCDLASRVTARPGMAFADAHAVLAYAGMGDEAAMTRLVDGLSDLVAQGHPVAEDVMLPLARGVWSFGRREYERAIQLLEPISEQIVRIGGSNAQREVYEETLLQAYLRAGRAEPAEVLLRKRLNRRPSARDARWLAQVRASTHTA
jgi:tetratricopeptide (TPR) repeat protein